MFWENLPWEPFTIPPVLDDSFLQCHLLLPWAVGRFPNSFSSCSSLHIFLFSSSIALAIRPLQEIVYTLRLLCITLTVASIDKLPELLSPCALSAGLAAPALNGWVSCSVEEPTQWGGSASGGLAPDGCGESPKQGCMGNGAPSGQPTSVRHRKEYDGSNRGIKAGCKTGNRAVSAEEPCD